MIAVGDDFVRAGDAVQALKYYQQAEQILQPLAEKVNNTVYRRGFAVSHTRMGDALLMLGRPAEALSHYRQEWQILRPLAAADPKDMVVQSTFTTSEGDIGHALVESGQVQAGKATLLRAVTRTAALAKAAGDSYSRALLASTLALAGEAYESGGDFATAQRYYAQALDLYTATSSADPDDEEDAVNVVIMHNHLGGVHLKLGNHLAALDDYRKALRVEEALAASSPDNIELIYAQADSYVGLGTAFAILALHNAGKKHPAQTCTEAWDWYTKSLNAWQRLPNPGRISPNLFRVTSPHEVARRISACKINLAKLER
jgi:tetratricopeptide (TPR) repeat protein